MNVSDYVVQFLEALGLGHVFTVSGGGSIFLCDALARAKSIKYVCCHHEQACTTAAEGYARARNHVGAAIVTSGPGGTNAVTGVAGAWLDGVPMIVISGQAFLKQTITDHPGLRQLGVQEINIVDIVRPITKYAVMVKHPVEIRYHLEKAWHLATTGRMGPVWLDIPGDIQNAEIDPEIMTGYIPVQEPMPSARVAARAVAFNLVKSQRPLIHIGQGVRNAGAEERLFRLLDDYGIPVVSGRNANDVIPSAHPCYIGRPGTFAQRGANFAVQLCDFYLAVGTRLTLTQTGYNSKDYARGAAQIVQVDIDQAELDKGTLRDPVKIRADAKAFLTELADALDELPRPDWSAWLARCQSLRDRYPVVLPEYKEQKHGINSYHFIQALSDAARADDVIVTDMGFAFQVTHQTWKVKSGQRLFTNCGLASMGWGLPAAIGAAIASSRRVILIAGEGGFQMTMQELATVMHHKLNIKMFVLNNGGYATIKQTQELGFQGRLMGVNEDTGLSFPDLSLVAASYGMAGGDLGNVANLNIALSIPGPFICQINLDPNQPQAPRAINRRNPDGSMNPTPLEDAWPFLSPEVIQKEMQL